MMAPKVSEIPSGSATRSPVQQVLQRFEEQRARHTGVAQLLVDLPAAGRLVYSGRAERCTDIDWIVRLCRSRSGSMTVLSCGTSEPFTVPAKGPVRDAIDSVHVLDGWEREPTDPTYDRAVCWWTLPYVSDPSAHIRDLAHLIKAGGSLVVACGVVAPWQQPFWDLVFAVYEVAGKPTPRMRGWPSVIQVLAWVRAAGLSVDCIVPFFHVEPVENLFPRTEAGRCAADAVAALSRVDAALLASQGIHRSSHDGLTLAQPTVVLRARKPTGGAETGQPTLAVDPAAVVAGRSTPFLSDALELAQPQRGDSVLDIGTGSGTAALAFASSPAHCHTVVGIDPAPPGIEAARGALAHLRATGGIPAESRVEFHVGAAERLRTLVGGRRFTIIIFWGSIHHLDDTEGAMREISAVAAPGARLLVLDAALPEESRDLWTLASAAVDLTTVEHRTYSEHLRLVREAGFVPTTVRPSVLDQNLDRWLSRIEGVDKRDPALTELAKRDLREVILHAPPVVRQQMRLREEPEGSDDWWFSYDTFVLLAERETR